MSYKDSIPIAHHPFGNGLSCGEAGYREYDLEKAKQLIAEYGKPLKSGACIPIQSAGESLFDAAAVLQGSRHQGEAGGDDSCIGN